MLPNSQLFTALLASAIMIGGAMNPSRAAAGIAHMSEGAAAQTIFISPLGNDNAPGDTPLTAIRTIARAHAMLKANPPVSGSNIRIQYLPGRHFDQSVTWDFTQPGVTVTIEPMLNRSFMTAIDGSRNSGDSAFFLRFRSAENSATGLTIRGLLIQNYCEGVSLGDWKSKGANSGSVIEGNWFNRIGSRYEATPAGQKPGGNCVAALRLQQSSANLIRNNRFTNIENIPQKKTALAKYGPLLLHAIYVSKQSSRNVISGNQFEKFTGSPIRIRDRSNDTLIENNSFREPIYVTVRRDNYVIKSISQWYCNEAVPECLVKANRGLDECPSERLQIRDNRVSGRLELYADESQSKVSTCRSRAQP